MNKRSRQEQIWVDKDFKKFLKEIIRKKALVENHDFSFADVTSDIVCNTELRNGIEEKLVRRSKNEPRLF